MKKETIIAVFFGVMLGGVLAFFLISKNKEIQLNKNKAIAPTQVLEQTTGLPTKVKVQSLEISQPQDMTITDKNSISVKGMVEKGSLLIIQSPVKELIVKPDSSLFDVSFPLALGENAIKIVAYPKDKTVRSQEKDLKIYYLDSEL